jgi:hypothetical protein
MIFKAVKQAPDGAQELEHGGTSKIGSWRPGHGAAVMGGP